MLVQQCYYYSPQWLQCYFTTFLKKRIQQPLPVAQWASFLIRMLKPFTVQERMTVPCIKIGSLGPRSLRETRSVWELDLHDWTESPCQIWQMLFQKQKQPARCCFLKCLALVGFSKNINTMLYLFTVQVWMHASNPTYTKGTSHSSPPLFRAKLCLCSGIREASCCQCPVPQARQTQGIFFLIFISDTVIVSTATVLFILRQRGCCRVSARPGCNYSSDWSNV